MSVSPNERELEMNGRIYEEKSYGWNEKLDVRIV